MKEMNSPSITDNKMELKNYTNDLTNENKPVQEVNNNLTSVQNNNQPSQQQSINNNSLNEQQSNQFVIKQENLLNSPSSSSNQNLNNSTSNIHTNSNQNNQQHHPNYTFEYWSQLMKDSKQLQSFSNIFMHVERLLEEEISRVRKALFQNNKFENQPLILPEPEGPIIQKQEKVYVPIHEHPNYNFVGRILGPRGMTAKQLEQETGCKIMIRGKGSMRNKHMEEQNRGKPNWEHLSDDLHVLIIVEDTENRAKLKIERAVEEVKKLLVPVTEGEDELKKKQLMELAIINGTYKDSNTRLLENEQLKLLPQASAHHTALAVSQQNLTHLNHLPLTPQLHHSVLRQSLGNSHANQSATAVSMIANTGHTGSAHNATVQSAHPSTSIGAPLMMAPTRPVNAHPLLLGANDSSTQQALAAAAAYLYPPHYDLGYAAQTINAQLTSASGFIEYPMASMAQVDAATGKQRAQLTGNGRDHPYQRPSSSKQ